MIELDYNKISELDPLGIDADIAELPELNATSNSSVITLLGKKMTRNFFRTGIETPLEGYAALRDLDFIASSLDRAGVDPFQEVNGLGDAMLYAGSVAESVPRSTITTYAGANPYGERRRSFTGSEEEGIFLDTLQISFDELEIAFNGLSELSTASTSEDFTQVLTNSTSAMLTMVDSIIKVKRTISPEFFTAHIRPYFDPLTIGGNMYAAAGGGQLQLVGMEKMLYGTTGKKLEDYKFFSENFPYLNLSQRERIEMFAEVNGNSTILSMLEARHKVGMDSEAPLSELINLTRTIRKFRYPHQKLALDNFKLRPADSVGSGSYTPHILAELIGETESRLQRMGEVKNAH